MAENSNEEIQKKKLKFEELKFFLKYLSPYKVQLFFASIALVISTLIGLLFPFATGKIIDTVIHKVPAEQSFFSGVTDINIIAGLIIFILFIQAILTYFQSFLFVRAGIYAVGEIRKNIFEHVIDLPMTFFTKVRVGDIISRLSGDINQIEDVLSFYIANFVRELILFMGSLCLLIYTSPRLTITMFLILSFMLLLIFTIGKKIKAYSKKTQEKLAEGIVVAEEGLQGIQTVKAFTAENFEKEKYRLTVFDFISTSIKRAKLRAGFVSMIISGMTIAIGGVLWYGIVLVRDGMISFGDLTSFVIYTFIISAAVTVLSDLYAHFQKVSGITERVLELLHTDTEILESQKLLLISPPNIIPHSIKGNIEFHHVKFFYPSRPEIEVLKDISFSIQQGERIALVGQSGSGKSTIISLLYRFYNYQSGTISIDGGKIDNYPLEHYRSHFAMVPQDVYLFGRTIKDNILYGKPGASDKEIKTAAEKANAHDFISIFPEGYDTMVGERGMKLSGGQRQRIAIARAILRDPKILILDEATSSLDSESEQLVQDALDLLMKDRTSIIIAHRLATIHDADKIIVLSDGTISEQGSHQELIEKDGGLYQYLSKLQFDIKM